MLKELYVTIMQERRAEVRKLNYKCDILSEVWGRFARNRSERSSKASLLLERIRKRYFGRTWNKKFLSEENITNKIINQFHSRLNRKYFIL